VPLSLVRRLSQHRSNSKLGLACKATGKSYFHQNNTRAYDLAATLSRLCLPSLDYAACPSLVRLWALDPGILLTLIETIRRDSFDYFQPPESQAQLQSQSTGQLFQFVLPRLLSRLFRPHQANNYHSSEPDLFCNFCSVGPVFGHPTPTHRTRARLVRQLKYRTYSTCTTWSATLPSPSPAHGPVSSQSFSSSFRRHIRLLIVWYSVYPSQLIAQLVQAAMSVCV